MSFGYDWFPAELDAHASLSCGDMVNGFWLDVGIVAVGIVALMMAQGEKTTWALELSRP